jgi:serine/threonine protein kinase
VGFRAGLIHVDVEEHTDEPTTLAPMEGPPPGTVLLDKYRVDWMLGVGGYGYVVKAHHLELGEAVAIKILRDDRETDPQTLKRFKREAQLVVRLKSEHVARVLDVGNLPNGAPYMIMELLEGGDLGHVLDSGPLPITTAVDYILQTCEAVAEAHSLGIVHRDIKPSNLFLAQLPGRPPIIKVLDFGISKSTKRRSKDTDLRLTQTQSILGTPAYMSPEQMRDAKSVDVRSDIWALGAVLYELVEGELPFEALNFAELVINVSTQDPRNMMLAPELRSVIERCLAKRLDERFQTVAELAQALAPFGTRETAREYVGRIFQLLGQERPSEESLSRMTQPERHLPRAMTPRPAATEVVDALPPMDHFITTTPDKRRRRFPWFAMLLVAVVASAATILAVMLLRSDPKDNVVAPADAARAAPTDAAEIATKPDKPDKPDKPAVGSANAGSAKLGSGSGSQKAGSAQKVGSGHKGNGQKVGPGSQKAGSGKGSAKKCDTANAMQGC